MFVRTVIAAALVAFATPALAGSILYGSDEKSLYTINTSTGVATVVGATGLTGFDDTNTGSILRDLTSSGSALYGAQWNVSTDSIRGAITTLNAATGAITSTVNITGLIETGFNQGVYAIAYDLSTNTLFGTTQRRLYTIDTTSGVASLVGSLTNLGQIGLGYDAGTNALYSVTQITDGNNVATTLLNTLDRTNAATLSSTALSINCGCDIAFDPLGNQGYLSSFTSDDVNTFGALERLNAGLTATTMIGLHGAQARANMSGLAFLGQTTAVPEPATWAMMIFGFGLVGGAVRHSAKRHSVGKLSVHKMG